MSIVPPSQRRPASRRGVRIAVIAPPFLPVPPHGYGGTERVVSVLVEGLVESGHDVTLVAGPGSRTAGRLLTPLPLPPPLGDSSSVTDELAHVLSLYRHSDDFDVIHDHTGVGPVLAAARAEGAPVVHTLHGRWTPAARRLYPLLADRVGLVAISRSQQAANPAVRYAGMVHNGIDMTGHPYNPSKEDFLLYVGRISPEKRPEVAVEVARRAGLPLKMIVKRSEPAERRYWDEVVEPVLGPGVEVMDQPPEAVKVEMLGRARALVFPIDWPEPFGLVMAEAMACGTPVIATPKGAAPEVVAEGSTGFLCAGVEEMVAAVGRCGDLDPADCRRHAQANFSAEAMVRGYERVYRDAMAAAAHSEFSAERTAVLTT